MKGSKRTTAAKQVLPPLPDAVATQLGPVPVVVVPKLAVKKDGKKYALFGRYRAISRVIEISAKSAPIMQWQTLFHEWVHVVLGDAGLHNTFTEEQQETIADVIATARAAELLDHLR